MIAAIFFASIFPPESTQTTVPSSGCPIAAPRLGERCGAVVHEERGPLDRLRVQLSRGRRAGAHRIHVRAGRDPLAVEDGFAGRRRRADDGGAPHRVARIRSGLDRDAVVDPRIARSPASGFASARVAAALTAAVRIRVTAEASRMARRRP